MVYGEKRLFSNIWKNRYINGKTGIYYLKNGKIGFNDLSK